MTSWGGRQGRGYKIYIRQDQDGIQGGGCAIFIKEEISYGKVLINHNTELEIVVAEIWMNKKVSYYKFVQFM